VKAVADDAGRHRQRSRRAQSLLRQGPQRGITTVQGDRAVHDMLMAHAVTGILHLINQTVIDWYSKKQSTVETATYGSVFATARTTVEWDIDFRTTLCYSTLEFQYARRHTCLVTISQW